MGPGSAANVHKDLQAQENSLPEGFPCQGATEESFSRSYFSMKKPKTILYLTISHEDIITRVTVSDSEVLSE